MADGNPSGTSTVERVGRPSWFVPVITFVVGLLLGGLVVFAVRSGESSTGAGAAGPTAPAAPAATGSGGPTTATLVVPAACLKVSDDASKLNDLARQAVAAARDLDAGELSKVVREIDVTQSTLREHAGACRGSKGSVTGSDPTTATSTAPTPVPGLTSTP